MEQVVLRLHSGEAWTYVGGNADAKKEMDVVIRAFDCDVLAAVGRHASAPTAETVLVPRGEGRRLVGRHFFARPADPGDSGLITYRGL